MATVTDRKDSKSGRKPRKRTYKKVKQYSYTCQICGTTVTSDKEITECCACGADSLTQLHEPLYIEPIDVQKDDSLRFARVLFKVLSIVILLTGITVIAIIAVIAITLIRCFF